jgi:hypothetical protein
MHYKKFELKFKKRLPDLQKLTSLNFSLLKGPKAFQTSNFATLNNNYSLETNMMRA